MLQLRIMNWMHIKRILFNHRCGSWAGALFFTFWIIQRFYFFHDQLFRLTLYALIWWLITLQFILFVASYLTRTQVRVHASGFIESIFPFFCAAMPFSLLVKHQYLPSTYSVDSLKSISILLLLGGTLFIIAGIIFLRKSFSIMTEVRIPIFTGIYSITRHPMYLGSIMTTLGTLFHNFSWLNTLLFFIFCGCQIYRAIREENKIMSIYPEYRKYAIDVGWFWKLGRQN